MQVTRRSAIASLLTLLAPSTAYAKARPFLVITGRTRSDAELVWTRSGLEALGTDVLTTTTPWHQGIQRFDGVRLATFLSRVGSDALTAVSLHALNDYTALVPMSDVRRYDPLLALRRNGADMPVADKGPMWLVYPFDRYPELDGPAFRARSVWQIDAMDLR
jgi:hypothetical protein